MAIQESGTKIPLSLDSFKMEREALQAVLKSALFQHSPRLADLLNYIAARYFEGEVHLIKEYALATEVLGRATSFDASRDAIVRVEVHRLRKKLKGYYAGEGINDPVAITIKTGQYIPIFLHREEITAAETPLRASDAGTGQEPIHNSGSGATVPPAYPFTRRMRVPFFSGLAVLACIGAIAVGFFYFHRGEKLPARAGSNPGTPLQTTNNLGPVSFAPESGARILCGYRNRKYIDSYGRAWDGDRAYTGGLAQQKSIRFISRTTDPGIFQTMRTGKFRYHIPLISGKYDLRLYFLETEYGPDNPRGGGENSRVFNVLLNGKPLLTNFDILADAGPNTADVRVFDNVQPGKSGFLDLTFNPRFGEPLLNAIEILPVADREVTPIRLVAQDKWITDRAGRAWSPDNFYCGGRYNAVHRDVSGADDPRLFRVVHYGHFSYAIPLDKGSYSATLYFAETFFGPHNPGGGGVGSRVFDVTCNGRILLSKFDIFAEAGGDHELKKTFYGLHPNAQGKLVFSFDPEVNYASLFAVEVLPEEARR